ncbi:hypothetical protein DY000_02040334 [Brassica cretica]|uniref:NYN domain-containing protein n=1 Tax=Brassica cretica TaxID=69181 RepID=A0ABQ7B9E7_BRACR|nr:hypothetical protein DY000_02040334 [Brassica cretica]
MRDKKAKKEAETWVFWDLNSCPVPKDCDARLVGSSIESALKKAGHCEGAVHVDRVTAHFPYLRSEGYTPLLAYPGNSKELTSRKNFSWETLLKADGEVFEDFNTHLKSRDHLERELCKQRRPPLKRKMEKPDFNVSEYNNCWSQNRPRSRSWNIRKGFKQGRHVAIDPCTSRSLRSDRPRRPVGRYITTDPCTSRSLSTRARVGRWVATDQDVRSVAT